MGKMKSEEEMYKSTINALSKATEEVDRRGVEAQRLSEAIETCGSLSCRRCGSAQLNITAFIEHVQVAHGKEGPVHVKIKVNVIFHRQPHDESGRRSHTEY